MELTPARPSGDAAQVVLQRHANEQPIAVEASASQETGAQKPATSALPEMMDVDFESLLAQNDGWTFV